MAIAFFGISIGINLTVMPRMHKMMVNGVEARDWFLPMVPLLSSVFAILGFCYV